jgi:hypothetical protein
VAQPVAGRGPQPPRPTAEELEAARHQAKEHADDPEIGLCPHCGVPRCEPWRTADAVILNSLRGMADPDSEAVE